MKEQLLSIYARLITRLSELDITFDEAERFEVVLEDLYNVINTL